MYTLEITGSGPDMLMFEEELFPVFPDMEISEEERWAYQKIVGSILFAVILSRPDIAFVASWLSRFNQRLVLRYMEVVKRVVWYLYKIWFLCL